MIEKITAQEFEDTTNHNKKNAVVFQEELRILMDLQDGEAIKFPCRNLTWEIGRVHGKRCPWEARITREAKRHGVRVKAKCVSNRPTGQIIVEGSWEDGGTMYALRVGPESGEQHDS